MEVYPSVSTSHFNINTKKRPRTSTDDFESHYFKKRLISNLNTPNSCNNSYSPNVNTSPSNSIDNTYNPDENPPETMDINDARDSHIQLFDINGTILPLEQKPGKPDYSIPDFILQDKPLSDDNDKQLILYQKNPLLPEHDFDNDSVTSEENDEQFESMDID